MRSFKAGVLVRALGSVTRSSQVVRPDPSIRRYGFNNVHTENVPRAAFSTLPRGQYSELCMSTRTRTSSFTSFPTSTRLALGAVTSLSTPALADNVDTVTPADAAVAATTIPLFASKALAVLPPLCFWFLQLAPMKTMQEIKSRKSVGQLSPLPFFSLLSNCTVWVLYGLFTKDLTVLLPNATGAACGAYYAYTYATHSTDKQQVKKYVAGSASIIGSVGLMALALPPDVAAHCIGLTGCTAAVVLLSSPLAVLGTVLREKNTSAMPFLTSVATLANSASWFGYGFLVAGDAMIWFPNCLGLAAALVQMSLFAIYPSKKPYTDKELKV